MSVECRACHSPLEDYKSLAQHILKHKDKAHRKGRKWAQSFLTKARILNQKRDLKPRTALTDEQKEAKKDCIRQLSGDSEIVNTICPHCKNKGRAAVESEYAHSFQAWKINDRLAVLCQTCRG